MRLTSLTVDPFLQYREALGAVRMGASSFGLPYVRRLNDESAFRMLQFTSTNRCHSSDDIDISIALCSSSFLSGGLPTVRSMRYAQVSCCLPVRYGAYRLCLAPNLHPNRGIHVLTDPAAAPIHKACLSCRCGESHQTRQTADISKVRSGSRPIATRCRIRA